MKRSPWVLAAWLLAACPATYQSAQTGGEAGNAGSDLDSGPMPAADTGDDATRPAATSTTSVDPGIAKPQQPQPQPQPQPMTTPGTVVATPDASCDIGDPAQLPSGGVFRNCDWAYEDLRGANFDGSDLTGTDMHGADLSGAIMGYSTLDSVDLSDAIVVGADLEGVLLRGAILRFTTLTDTNLWGADLSDAEMLGANLARADLTGANCTGANLATADLTGASLADVRWDNTTCPDGTNSDLQGTCDGHLSP